jgi:hypothetical protein
MRNGLLDLTGQVRNEADIEEKAIDEWPEQTATKVRVF